MEQLGFARSEPADTGRPGYDPRKGLRKLLSKAPLHGIYCTPGITAPVRRCIKYRIFGHPRLLLRGRTGAHTELSLAVMAYNLKRMANVLGNTHLTMALQKN